MRTRAMSRSSLLSAGPISRIDTSGHWVATARSACVDDLGAEECRDARSTLRDCAQSCLTTRRTATEACRSTVDECLDACDDTSAE